MGSRGSLLGGPKGAVQRSWKGSAEMGVLRVNELGLPWINKADSPPLPTVLCPCLEHPRSSHAVQICAEKV